MNREIKLIDVTCKHCGIMTQKKSSEGKLFCDRRCYMDWKRLNPSKWARKERINISGYWYIYKPDHPNAIKQGRYVAEHRLVMESKLGRYLTADEIPHHKDDNGMNNHPDNLELKTISGHNKDHALNRRRDEYGQFTTA